MRNTRSKFSDGLLDWIRRGRVVLEGWKRCRPSEKAILPTEISDGLSLCKGPGLSDLYQGRGFFIRIRQTFSQAQAV
ncbi:hypothetical protein [Neisseria chenwenguii]|uniref:hypothetical protein n=1 Tax=Neisseria chenwenguii TaxID=1853278 RepID=UPI000F4D958A|nr:hypothetical protein [Neisseria chenwenguii]